MPVANGGVGACNAYTWSQTLSEVVVVVQLPGSVTARSLIVDLSATRLSVRDRISGRIFVAGELEHAVKTGDDAEASLWTLDAVPASACATGRPWDNRLAPFPLSDASAGGAGYAPPLPSADSSASTAKLLTVTLEKKVPTWWRCVVRGDPEIDAAIIDSTVPMHEYDAETQAAIRKVMAERGDAAAGGAGHM